jgi:hypothetical protein
MKLVLLQIKRKYNIPPGTMRSAISRGVVVAEKEGKILMVDDQGETFLAFHQHYRPRSIRATSTRVEELDGQEATQTGGQSREKSSSSGPSLSRKG